MKMTIRIDFEISEIVIMQNMIKKYVEMIEDGKLKITLDRGITQKQFIDTIMSITRKLFDAGRSIGDDMI